MKQDKIFIYETKQAIKEVKENKTSDAFEFLNELKNEVSKTTLE